MRIQKITLNNIGPYVGKNTIAFNTVDTTKNIVLIGGRNGAGKTTIFDAMKICLYGYMLYGYRQNSQTYTTRIKKLINDNIKRTSEPKAEITLSVFIDDGYFNNIYTISRNWTLHNNQIKEMYTVSKDSILLNDEERNDFDDYLLQTIPPALFNFHFFNGENIAEILFSKETGQSFRKAFMQICGLDTLDLIKDQLQNNVLKNSKEYNPSAQEDFYKKKEQKEQLETMENELFATLNNVENEIVNLEEENILLEREMARFGGVQSHEWQHLQEKIRIEENLRESSHKFLKESANHLLPFLILKDELSELQHQVQIESHISSNKAIQERLLKVETKNILSNKLAEYLNNDSTLTEDFFQVLYNAIKYECPENAKERLGLSEREHITILSKIGEWLEFDVGKIIDAEKAIKKSLSKSKKLRTKADSKEVLSSESYLSKKNELLTKIDDLRKQAISLTAKKTTIDENVKKATQEFDKTAAKFKGLLKEKSVSDISARALLAFDELRQKLYCKYISQVETSFVRNLNSLLTKDNLLDGIYISKDFEVVPYKYSKINISELNSLIKANGDVYVKEYLGERAFKMLKDNKTAKEQIELPVKIEQHFSAGEQQIYVMALYQALSEIRLSEVPFVIDTPLARIDSIHRKNILNSFFSKLPGQVIILSTDEEIDFSGIKTLQSQISDLYLIENQKDGTAAILSNQYFKEASN